ncbi:phage minor capsid protein [Enorma massiliensis]|uniref:Phage capsid protein n=1 Tax=Enorma massiliensis TaxID=1472761 RepID=A0A1Y3U4S1_9ACTN|nr:phage minor capsid protein [Enorma massiliensis]OUN43766.1 hypothetical protein B5G21_03510 [Enorma massiliensis]
MAADRFDALAAEIVHGSQEEFVARLTREFAQMLEQGVSNPDRLAVLARLSRDAALAVWAEYEGRVDEECAAAFEEALAAEDEAMLDALKTWAAVDAYDTGYAALRAAEAARGVAEIMRRQNVAMCDALADSWYRITAQAVAEVESGGSRRAAMERGCAALADAGLQTIDYRSGVSTAVDAALRRHVVTQWNQARNDLLMRRMDEWGVDLVFTSAHFGARPSHAAWQGKVFSRSGSSPDYPGLAESTGYGTVTGLCGANCRHTMTPYVEGYSKLPDTDWSEQERLTGMTSDEYYEATQRQRRYELAIRRTKREIATGRELGLDMADKRVLLGRQQARVRQWCAEKGLPRDYERERAYGVGRQPRSLSTGALSARRAKAAAFEGSFGSATAAARTAYLSSRDLGRTMYDRIGIRPDIGSGVANLTPETRAAIMSGIEHGIGFVGGPARNLKFVTTSRLGRGVIAQAERRGDSDLVIRISPSGIGGRSMDDVEQIMFHEVAHAAEWRLTSGAEWEREADRLIRWRERGGALRISRSSAKIEEALKTVGYSVAYDDRKGQIVLSGKAAEEASAISWYAVGRADTGTQDSELIAESIRFVAMNGRGKNRLADVIVEVLLDGH